MLSNNQELVKKLAATVEQAWKLHKDFYQALIDKGVPLNLFEIGTMSSADFNWFIHFEHVVHQANITIDRLNESNRKFEITCLTNLIEILKNIQELAIRHHYHQITLDVATAELNQIEQKINKLIRYVENHKTQVGVVTNILLQAYNNRPPANERLTTVPVATPASPQVISAIVEANNTPPVKELTKKQKAITGVVVTASMTLALVATPFSILLGLIFAIPLTIKRKDPIFLLSPILAPFVVPIAAGFWTHKNMTDYYLNKNNPVLFKQIKEAKEKQNALPKPASSSKIENK